MFDEMTEKTVIVLIITVGLVVIFNSASNVGIERAKLEVEKIKLQQLIYSSER